jgi:hypothetical protein
MRGPKIGGRSVGRRVLEDLDLHLQHAVLAAQAHDLGALLRRQPLAAAFVDVRLPQPVAQRLVGGAKIRGELRDRLLTQPRLLHRAFAELLRVPSGHPELLSPWPVRHSLGVRKSGVSSP